jgi:quinol monooxygenase YgiN
MAYTGPAISLHVSITVAPENVQKFLEALKPAYDAVCAEPNNTFFEVYQKPDQPGTFKFVENWNADTQWMMEVRIFQPKLNTTVSVTSKLWTRPKTSFAYQAVYPRPNEARIKLVRFANSHLGAIEERLL